MRLLAPGALADLPEIVLLAPLHVGPEQTGALLMGAKPDGPGYTAEDQAMLETLSDPLVVLLHTAQLQEAQAQVLDQTLAEFRRREQSLEQQQQAFGRAQPLWA